jgi:hypothetical protein
MHPVMLGRRKLGVALVGGLHTAEQAYRNVQKRHGPACS